LSATAPAQEVVGVVLKALVGVKVDEQDVPETIPTCVWSFTKPA